ncbi:MAG: hypothetical protein K2L16_00480 [Muribaculaceae bacterium]|nr:hypothetical protein [Muribaculaceae bacterium]
MDAPTPLEQALREAAVERAAVVGLPASRSDNEHRFPLTPEGAAQLVQRGFKVRMERGAASHIHYSDEAYTRCGVEIVDRAEAFGGDIVVYLPAIDVADARLMRRGALLLTFLHCVPEAAAGLECLLHRHIITIALDCIADAGGQRPFADILHEIDGRAAVAIASSLLADAIHGKGILLGGVAGIVPCEVMIIGSDMAAVAAGSSAIGLGATVRIFDNDIYRLRSALERLGPGAIGSSLHPRVFEKALASADIVIATDTSPRCGVVDSAMMDVMKKGVISFDLSDAPGSAFPAMPVVDLDLASPSDARPGSPVRMCYINAGNAVPRTVAMALSNTFVSMLDEILVCDGVANALKLNCGLRHGAVTFLGKCVNSRVARLLGIRPVDISLFLQFS